MIILHGLLGSTSNWGCVAKHLQQRYRVVRADLRYHGDSPHAESISYGEMAEDVLALLERLGLDKACLLGHSLGGKVAMVCALTSPQRVRHLIVVDIAPVAYGQGFDDLIESLPALPLDEVSDRPAADRWLASRIEDPGVRSFLCRTCALSRAVTDGASISRRLPRTWTRSEAFRLSPALTRSGHVYPGGEVALVREEHHAQIMHFFPNATILTVPNAGHWPHSEQPERFLDVLAQGLVRD